MEENQQDGGQTQLQPAQRGQSGQTRQKKSLKELLAHSSLNGFSHIAASKSWLTGTFWTLVAIGGLIGFGMNLFALITRYSRCPVLETFIPEAENFVWPDITLCNPVNPLPFWKFPQLTKEWRNLLRRQRVYGRAIYKRGIKGKFTSQLGMSTWNPKRARFEAASRMVFNVINNTFSDDDAMLQTYDSSNQFSEKFRHKFYSRLVSRKFQIPCLTFNVAGFNGTRRIEEEAGAIKNLRMAVIMDQDSYNIFNADYESRKISIFITPPGHTVDFMETHYAIPGSNAVFKLSMHHMYRLPARGMCVDEPFKVELYDVFFDKTHIYYGKYGDCQMFVKQKNILEKCGCYDPELPIFKSHQHPPRLCLNMSLYTPEEVADNMECRFKVAHSPRLKYLVEQECSKFIKPICNTYHYMTAHDSIPWPEEMNPARDQYLKLIGFGLPNGGPKKFKSGFLKKNLMFLIIQRRGIKADVIREEYTYVLSQFVSDLGGAIGLWLGLSVISVFELVALLFHACHVIVM